MAFKGAVVNENKEIVWTRAPLLPIWVNPRKYLQVSASKWLSLPWEFSCPSPSCGETVGRSCHWSLSNYPQPFWKQQQEKRRHVLHSKGGYGTNLHISTEGGDRQRCSKESPPNYTLCFGGGRRKNLSCLVKQSLSCMRLSHFSTECLPNSLGISNCLSS